MNKKFGPLVAIAVLLLIALNASFFMVDETKQAILVQLGKPVSGVQTPGLHMKIPFIQEAIFFERRLLDYDAHPAEILTKDKKNLVVDNYAKWKIIDPLKFYTTVRNVSGALARLDDIVFAELRVELGRYEMAAIISELRPEIMEKVTVRADKQLRDFGISVVDVRIKRADLPRENERAVFGRMQAEREREAKRYRSEGEEEALKLRAAAEKKRTIILAEAYRKSQELKGQGDGEATRIYAEAFGKDPNFFNFLRSLESYQNAMDSKTTVILSQEDEFLQFFKESGAGFTDDKKEEKPEPALSVPTVPEPTPESTEQQ